MGTDVHGNAQEETIPAFASATTVKSTKVCGTVTSVVPNVQHATASVSVGVLNTIAKKAALVTVTISTGDDSDKTITVTGVGMDGTSLSEVTARPAVGKTVTGEEFLNTYCCSS